MGGRSFGQLDSCGRGFEPQHEHNISARAKHDNDEKML